jgi:putative NIF3 family GTP cyclohydrolase 1 type 2
MAKKLGIRALRAIGDPNTVVSRIAVVPGAAGPGPELMALPHADVYVCGEATEWEGIEYARDTITATGGKGMILLGHVTSEEPGMRVCTTWLKGFVTEIPVEWVPAHEAVWVPPAR